MYQCQKLRTCRKCTNLSTVARSFSFSLSSTWHSVRSSWFSCQGSRGKRSMKNHWNTTSKLLIKASHCVFILKQRRSMFTNIVCIWMKCRWRKTALCGALLPLCRDLRVVRHTTKHKPCQCHNKFWTWWMVTIVPGKCILRRNWSFANEK